jgi:cephalosporin hydroxylase
MDIKGRVIGVDVEIRSHNQNALDNHPLRHMIELVVGSSADPGLVARIRASIKSQDRVLVVLDSNHSRAHVRAELELYHSLVSSGSYLVVTDGIMRDLADAPRGNPEWLHDNPVEAAKDFVSTHSDFVLQTPAWPFNESTLSEGVSHWPSAWLLRRPAHSGQVDKQ